MSVGQEKLKERLRQDLETGEAQAIEFMSDFPDNTWELAKEIAAFSTSNRGIIYLGVDDDAHVVGVKIGNLSDTSGKDSYQRRISGVSNSIDPRSRVKVDFIDYDGRIVVKIAVPKGVEPVYYVGGKPYLRDLSTSRPATASEVKELYRQYFVAKGLIEGRDERKRVAALLIPEIKHNSNLASSQVEPREYVPRVIKREPFRMDTYRSLIVKLLILDHDLTGKIQEFYSVVETVESRRDVALAYLGREKAMDLDAKLELRSYFTTLEKMVLVGKTLLEELKDFVKEE